MYQTFDHTADLGLRVRADSVERLFQEAALGLTSVFVENVQDVRCEREVSFQIDGTDLDYLLFDWLNELLFQFEHHGQVFSDFHVSLPSDGLTAVAKGESFDPERHRALQEVKAITYHGFEVREQDGLWLAEVILDL